MINCLLNTLTLKNILKSIKSIKNTKKEVKEYPFLDYFLIETFDQKVKISYNDTKKQVEYFLPAQVSREGKILINKSFINIISLFDINSDTFINQIDSKNIEVIEIKNSSKKMGFTDFTIFTHDFLSFSPAKAHIDSFSIDSIFFVDACKKFLNVVSQVDDFFYKAPAAIQVGIKNHILSLVGTNGHSIFYTEYENMSIESIQPFFIPHHVIEFIAKNVKAKEEKLFNLYIYEAFLKINYLSLSITSKIYDKIKMPNYRHRLNSISDSKKFELNKIDLQKISNIFKKVNKDDKDFIQVHQENDELVFSTKGRVTCEKSLKILNYPLFHNLECNIFISNQFLAAGLKLIDSNIFDLELKDATSPIILRPKNTNNIYIFMPVVSEGEQK